MRILKKYQYNTYSISSDGNRENIYPSSIPNCQLERRYNVFEKSKLSPDSFKVLLTFFN